MNGEWIGQFSSSRQPIDAVRFSTSNLDPASFKSLTSIWSRTSLTAADLTPAKDFRWKSHDGLEIQGWLYRPQGKVRGTVVFVHGGPTGHSTDAVNNEIQFYVHCGFNVLDPNYRGSTGFGVIFRDAILKRVGAPMNRLTSAPGLKPCLFSSSGPQPTSTPFDHVALAAVGRRVQVEQAVIGHVQVERAVVVHVAEGRAGGPERVGEPGPARCREYMI